MLKKSFPKLHTQQSTLPVLGSHLDDFIKFLHQLGYSMTSIYRHVRVVRILDRRLRRLKCDTITKISHANLQACEHPQKGGSKTQVAVSSTVKLLMRYFDDRGMLPPPIPLALTPVEEKLTDFKDYLQNVRGLAPTTVRQQYVVALEFITWFETCGGLSYLPKLTLQDLEDFLHDAKKGISRLYLHKVISYLRSFLRFLAMRGEIIAGLDTQIEAPCIYQGERLPRTLSWETVRVLLKSIDRSTAIGKRDYSMVLLVATYGLRASEVADLKLDDIDWRTNCLRIFQRKTTTSVILPLTTAVGKSIVAYLRYGRPSSLCREIFVRHRAPHEAFTSGAVSSVFRKWSSRNGLPIQFQGVHCLRHSCAVHLLRQGTSLKAIGDILGHKDIRSTCIYLRLAIEDLRTVPLNFPIKSTTISQGALS